jgi:hypothetical protein
LKLGPNKSPLMHDCFNATQFVARCPISSFCPGEEHPQAENVRKCLTHSTQGLARSTQG